MLCFAILQSDVNSFLFTAKRDVRKHPEGTIKVQCARHASGQNPG